MLFTAVRCLKKKCSKITRQTFEREVKFPWESSNFAIGSDRCDVVLKDDLLRFVVLESQFHVEQRNTAGYCIV